MCFSVTAVTFFNCSPSLNFYAAVHKNPIKTKRQNYKAHARNSQALLSAACTMNIQTGKQRTVSAQTCICLLSPHSFTADVSGPTACLRRRFFLDVRKARLRLRRLRELALVLMHQSASLAEPTVAAICFFIRNNSQEFARSLKRHSLAAFSVDWQLR